MNLCRKALAVAAASAIAVCGMSIGSAAPAFAINRAYPCNGADTGQFLEFYSNESTCWANSGGVNVELYNVTDVYTGNNSGEFFSPQEGLFIFPHWFHIPSGYDWYPGVTVTVIDIS
jgi:hypothetical protein